MLLVQNSQHLVRALSRGRARKGCGPRLGAHTSSSRGSSDPDLIRGAMPGDNARHIHVPSTLRTGKPTVRTFTDDRQRTVRLVVDVDQRMVDARAFSSKPKDFFLRSLAAHLAYGHGSNGDRVSLTHVSGQDPFTSKLTDKQVGLKMNRLLSGLVPTSADSSLARLLLSVPAAHSAHESLVVFSDFYSANWEALLPRLAGVNRSITFIHVMDPLDFHVTEDIAMDHQFKRSPIEWTDASGYHLFNLRKEAERRLYNEGVAQRNAEIHDALAKTPRSTVIPTVVTDDMLSTTLSIWQDRRYNA